MTPAIECRNLVKTYPGKPPVEAVRGIDLDVASGECFGLLGPNGAGKTTTCEMMEGLLEPTSGNIRVLGLDWANSAAELRHRIGLSLQETRLTDKLTVLETLRLFRAFHDRGITPEQAMDMVSLGEKRSARVVKLSGGQKQRLAVACAMVGDPDLVFLDEPTTGLDPQSRRQLWEIIRDFRDRGRTILLTTHYMDEAERLCDRIAIIDHGKVIARGSPRELIASIGGEHVVEFSLREPGADADRASGAAGDRLPAAERFAGLPSVSAAVLEAGRYRLTVGEPHLAIPALLGNLGSSGLDLAELTTRHVSLEDVFVKLTGRHLRDDGPRD
jgi:ABC-2 type transport system ATP-binding protein